MDKIVNYFNKIELYFLIAWTFLILIEKLFLLHLGIVIIISSSTLSLLYMVQATVAEKQLKEKSFLVKFYPYVLGFGSAILIMGIFFKTMHYPGAEVQSSVGMVVILASCLFLFYPPVQDEFLPVLKKILLRLFLLISLGLLVSL